MNYSYPAPWKATLQKSQPTLLHAFHAMPSWGHGGTYNRFAISPQNNILLTGGDDYIIKWWSASGQLMRTSYGHTSQIVAFDFHPTGTMVASGEFEGTIHIWDVPSGRCILTIKVHEPVTQITWSPNGKWLMVLTDSLIDEHIVVLIYAESSPQPIAIYQLKDPVHNIDNFGASWWSEDQVLMLQEAGASFSANLWEVHSNTFQPLPEIFDRAIKCLTRPGGSSRDDSTPKDHLVLFLPHAYSLNIALSPNHQYLMLEKNHCVTFWNLKTLTQQGILRGSWSSIPHHAWSPDSQEFCLAGDDGLLYFYTMSSGQTNTWNIDLKGGVWNISWFPHKDRLIMHLFDCTEILDIRTRTVLYQLPYNKGFPEAFAWGGPAGDLMAMGTSDGKIRLWKYASGEVIREWTPFKHDCELLRWDPKGNILLAYERYQYELTGWNLRENYEQFKLPISCNNINERVAWSPDGKKLAVGAGVNVEIWNMDTYSREILLKLRETTCLLWSWDSRFLAIEVDGEVSVYNLESQTMTPWGRGTLDPINNICWIPNAVFFPPPDKLPHPDVVDSMDLHIDGESHLMLCFATADLVGTLWYQNTPRNTASHHAPLWGISGKATPDIYWNNRIIGQDLGGPSQNLNTSTSTPSDKSQRAMSPNSRFIVLGDHLGRHMKVWQLDGNAISAEPINRLQQMSRIITYQFHPSDRSLVAAADRHGDVMVWNLRMPSKNPQSAIIESLDHLDKDEVKEI